MSKTMFPKGYAPALSLYETQTAIGMIKRSFADRLAQALNLKRVSAPLFVAPETGLNDDLNGVERPVVFDIADAQRDGVVVHSLAKWKRFALYKYNFPAGEGLYTDMNAIRRDELLDNLHSVYTDQWDWEKVITRDQRTLDYLRATMQQEVDAICDTLDELKAAFPQITTTLSRAITFISTVELEELYPELEPKEREAEFMKTHKTCCFLQIGDLLPSGVKHDGRAPDYDDWSLNGDIVFWSDVLQCPLEVSSMGIRVDAKTLDKQLRLAGADDRRRLPFHELLLRGDLPLTMGGGIGQSRLCMLLLGKAHIGEVQCSIWDEETLAGCAAHDIPLL